MDDIVKQAMAKWPNVPHCYGWLALDARGGWRMRDEHAQQAGLPGDRLTHAALVGFINRNYAADAGGRWYFQNGPQRVYVDLQAAPFIARTDPALGLVVQTGTALSTPEHAYMTPSGALLVQGAGMLAQVDDRDVAHLLAAMQIDGKPADDAALMAWLDGRGGQLTLRLPSGSVDVALIADGDLAQRFGFIARPRGESTDSAAAA